MDAIDAAVQKSDLKLRLLYPASTAATADQVAAIHGPRYVQMVAATAERGGGWLDWDTQISAGSYRAALAAAGCAMSAVDVVMAGGAQSAFALVRPPGHHARPARGMGFCLFNNIAIAAHHALAVHGLERVLIVDFDAHHGNGTQEAFYSSAQVLYFSTHQSPFYPGTGGMAETGEGPGSGYTVNVPLPALSGDAAFERVYTEILTPLAHRFHPQLILASAGYDLHWADPLTDLGVSIKGVAHIVGSILAVADQECPGRLVLTLEGGYDHEVLAAGVTATLRVLLGDKEKDVLDPLGPGPEPREDISALVARVKALHRL